MVHYLKIFLSSKQTWTSKEKFISGNQALLMNSELQKEIYIRSKLRNNFWREPSVDNKAAYYQQISKCVRIRRKHYSLSECMNAVSQSSIEKKCRHLEFYKTPFNPNLSGGRWVEGWRGGGGVNFTLPVGFPLMTQKR